MSTILIEWLGLPPYFYTVTVVAVLATLFFIRHHLWLANALSILVLSVVSGVTNVVISNIDYRLFVKDGNYKQGDLFLYDLHFCVRGILFAFIVTWIFRCILAQKLLGDPISDFKYRGQPPAEPEVIPEKEPEKDPEPYRVPLKKRFEHTLVLGGTGAGKTSLFAELITDDMATPCSVVVFDSKGSLVDKLLRVNYPRERVVLINPTDEQSVALGLFDFDTSGATLFEREKKLNQVIELLSFVMGALDTEPTSKQELPLRFLIRLCLTIPNATILTMRDLLMKDGPQQYDQYIQALPETARLFFLHEFSSKDLAGTREQLQRRVYTILENPTLERMFSSPKTRLNMSEALDEGKLILVNTAKGALGEQRSAFFSRFITALVTQAIQSRDLSKDNTPAFVYIDEAAPIIDANITNALETLREYKGGLTIAFQSLGQIASEFQHSLIANTSTKYLASLSAKDARALSDDVRTSHESLLNLPPHTFYFHVKGEKTPRSVTTKRDVIERLPKRTDLKELLKENREKYCIQHYAEKPKAILKVAEDDFDA